MPAATCAPDLSHCGSTDSLSLAVAGAESVCRHAGAANIRARRSNECTPHPHTSDAGAELSSASDAGAEHPHTIDAGAELSSASDAGAEHPHPSDAGA